MKARDIIEIDGSMGEGGGQVLRSSLSLSVATGRALRIRNIRAGRKKPGLLRQHLTCVQAAARVSAARVEGDEPGSQELLFEPGSRPQAGKYRFAIGSAGSSTLVFQTILPMLLLAEGDSEVRIEGGTHNPLAPPFDFLSVSFLPLLKEIGADIEAELERAGFVPAGGGAAVFRIRPLREKRFLKLLQPGELKKAHGRILLSQIEESIGEREAKVIRRKTGWPSRIERPPSPGPGNCVLLLTEHERVTQVFTGFGQKGRAAETVAKGVSRRALDFLDTGAVACEYLSDQLLLPLALFGGGSFTSAYVSEHTSTNIDVIRSFLDVAIDVTAEGQCWRIDVKT